MIQDIKDSQNYKRYEFKCRCSCKQHCGHSCLDCDYCTECECENCKSAEAGKVTNGLF